MPTRPRRLSSRVVSAAPAPPGPKPQAATKGITLGSKAPPVISAKCREARTKRWKCRSLVRRLSMALNRLTVLAVSQRLKLRSIARSRLSTGPLRSRPRLSRYLIVNVVPCARPSNTMRSVSGTVPDGAPQAPSSTTATTGSEKPRSVRGLSIGSFLKDIIRRNRRSSRSRRGCPSRRTSSARRRSLAADRRSTPRCPPVPRACSGTGRSPPGARNR